MLHLTILDIDDPWTILIMSLELWKCGKVLSWFTKVLSKSTTKRKWLVESKRSKHLDSLCGIIDGNQ